MPRAFPSRRRRIEYHYKKYWSCSRAGAQGTGRFGGVTEKDYNNLHCIHCLSGVVWQRGVYAPVANGGILAVELSTGGALG